MSNRGVDPATVVVRLLGGLGNQLFQYAAARALAIRRAAVLKLDVSAFASYGLRRYELGSYPLVATVIAGDELAALQLPSVRSKFGRLLEQLSPGRRKGPLLHYREPHYLFDPHLADQPLPLLMDGYWQSERYFIDAADAIRHELSPREPLESLNADIAAQIDATTAVSLHVRRGDYVTNSHTNAYHGVCSLEYYRAAIDFVRGRVLDPHLYVFSDDHEWTRQNLILDFPTTYVTVNSADRGYRDMQLMSRCKHHVIANSSFSWWGAWLNPSPDKIVVAPERWFAGGENDPRDLLPRGWIRL